MRSSHKQLRKSKTLRGCRPHSARIQRLLLTGATAGARRWTSTADFHRRIAPMVNWTGTADETDALMAAITRNCQCTYGLMGMRIATCIPHQALLADQRWLNGL